MLSKHQDRSVTPPGSPLAELLAVYGKALLDNGHAQASRTPYAYAAFPSGRPVSGAMRRRALRAAREQLDVAIQMARAAEQDVLQVVFFQVHGAAGADQDAVLVQ